MPKREFALEVEGPKVVRLEWKGSFKNLQVFVHDTLVGTVADKKALTEGASFGLADGSTLKVRLEGSLTPILGVLRDGVPLPGSDSDPAAQMRAAAGLIYFIAGLNALLGIATMMFDIEALKALTGENGLGALLMALMYSVLAYFTMGGSVTALVIAMVVYAADWLAGFAFSVAEGARPNVGGIIVRIFFLALMWRGLKGGFELRKQRKARATAR